MMSRAERQLFTMTPESTTWDRNPATWTTGAKVPLDACITTMADKHLGKALAHHKVVLHLPKDWWVNPRTQLQTACTVMCMEMKGIKNQAYLNCQVILPTACRDEGHIIRFPVSSQNGIHTWNIRRLLNLQHNNPPTLDNIGIETVPGVSAITSVLAAWSYLQEVKKEIVNPPPPHVPLYAVQGPFEDREQNIAWVQRVALDADQDILAHVDILEPDSKSHKEAL
jgi:hypothetical protein